MGAEIGQPLYRVSGLRYCAGSKEGVLEAMKSFTKVKTYSLPWEI